MIKLTKEDLNHRLFRPPEEITIPHYLFCMYCGKVTTLWTYGTGIVQACWNCGRTEYEMVKIVEDEES